MEGTATTSSDGTPIVPEFNAWLEELVAGEGSDLHVKVGSAPMIRLPKGLTRLDRDPLTGIETQAIADGIIPEDRKQKFDDTGEVDFAYSIPNVGRFRVNVFRQRELDQHGAAEAPLRRALVRRDRVCRTPSGRSPTSTAA